MKICFLGDSITVGTHKHGISNPNYAQIVGKNLNAEINNYAYNGITLVNDFCWKKEYALFEQEKRCEDCDILFIAVGTNDWSTDAPLGEKNDVSEKTFYGSLNLLCKKLKNRKNTKIIFITPINRFDEDKLHNDLSLDCFREAISFVASNNGFFVIRGEKINLNPNDKDFFADGLHPEEKGHKIYAQYIMDCLKDFSIV